MLPTTCDPEPVASIQTPNSVLGTHGKKQLLFAGKKVRTSTCMGVAWLRDDCLVALGQVNSSVQVYSFSEENGLEPKEGLNGASLRLSWPENISYFPDGQLLAITNYFGAVDLHLLKEEPSLASVFLSSHPGKATHGIRFSPTGQHVAYTSLQDKGAVVVCSVTKDGLRTTCTMSNPFFPLKPKSIDFTRDGEFAVIGFTLQLSPVLSTQRQRALLASFRFDCKTGKLEPTPISISDEFSAVEASVLCPRSCCVYSTDQVTHRIMMHRFDAKTGQLGSPEIVLENPAAQLSFPHGLDISPDGRFLAVTNCGDDKLTIYRRKTD